MEDEGKMDELIEQMKLMNVLLSKRDKREETKENFYTNNKIGLLLGILGWILVWLCFTHEF
jgi:N-acetylglutamate synthase-like GNAT family acetyltransferase